jgi:nucleoside-diphosphate-sugar epimerase
LGAPGELATEDMDVPRNFPYPRVSEQAALALKDVNASVVRLPQVHDTVKQGLVTYLIALAREKGFSAYVGEGRNRWSAAHVSDVARLYRLVLDKNEAGEKYHAVAEEGVSMRDIAEAIGRGLKIPVKSVSPEDAQSHFGLLAVFATHDLQASSAITRKKLGWNPTGPGLIADLEQMRYHESDLVGASASRRA